MAQKTVILATISVGFLGGSAVAETYQAPEFTRSAMPAQCHAEEITQGVPAIFAEGAEIIQPELVDRVEPIFQSKSDILYSGSASESIECATFVYSVSAMGAVDNIELVYYSEGRDKIDAFIVAAEEALSQWRFEPGQVEQELQAFMGYSVAFDTAGTTIVKAAYAEHEHDSESLSLEIEGRESGYLDQLESQILADNVADMADDITPQPVFLEDQVSPFVAAMVRDERAEPMSTINTPLSSILVPSSIQSTINADVTSVITETIETDIPFPSLFAE